MKSRILALFFVLSTLISAIGLPVSASGSETPKMEMDAKSAIVMEASTRTVLYEDNADQPLPPASVTKIMTLLLVMEAVDSGKIKLTDPVSVSEHAASMAISPSKGMMCVIRGVAYFSLMARSSSFTIHSTRLSLARISR